MDNFDYQKLLDEARECGEDVSPRGLPTTQINPLSFTLALGELVKRKGFNEGLALAEAKCLIQGYTDVEAIRSVAPKTAEAFYDVNDMSFYGERVHIRSILRRLNADPTTRKATATLLTNEDPDRSTRCITEIQFQAIQGFLNMFVHLRSWDLYRGLPYDIAMTQWLGCYVARCLNFDRGEAYYHASLPHLYEAQFERSRDVRERRHWVPPLLEGHPPVVHWEEAEYNIEYRFYNRGG